MQITQTTAQIPVTAQATLEKTQALTLLKTADSQSRKKSGVPEYQGLRFLCIPK